MPKLTPKQMEVRRRAILEAARACFIRNGFRATTMSNIADEASMSIGGIYVHFDSKHAIARAIGGQATEGAGEHSGSFLDLFAALQTEAGESDARLDLNLWAEGTRDDAIGEMVHEAFDAFRARGVDWAGERANAAGWGALLEALAAGLEVQRALGRPVPPELAHALAELLEKP